MVQGFCPLVIPPSDGFCLKSYNLRMKIKQLVIFTILNYISIRKYLYNLKKLNYSNNNNNNNVKGNNNSNHNNDYSHKNYNFLDCDYF